MAAMHFPIISMICWSSWELIIKMKLMTTRTNDKRNIEQICQLSINPFTTPIFHARHSGSFPGQSNKMNEGYVIWRQINNAVYIY